MSSPPQGDTVHYKQALGAVAIALLTACSDPTANSPRSLSRVQSTTADRADPEWIDEAFPFSIAVHLDCLNETVTWSGTVLYHYHVVTLDDGRQHFAGSSDLAPGST